MNNTRPALEFHDVTVSYGKKPVLWDIDVEIPQNSLVAIVGPNGAGKSTLLKSALGIVSLTTGYVRINGEKLSVVRKQVGYVPQRESVDWDFPISVLGVVLMGRYGFIGWCRNPSATDKRIALESLEAVGLAGFENRQIGQLSGGQQQRVFIARALAQKADIYLMDEPFAGVDASTESAIIRILRTLRDQGKTVVVVHHDLQTVPDYFDHVVLLNLRLVAAGPVAQIFSHENLQRTFGGRLTALDQVTEAVRRGELARVSSKSQEISEK